jgi:Zn-finger nucleic acid-binding protein
MQCPKCSGKFSAHRVNGVALDVCEGCRAVWCESGELKPFVQTASFYEGFLRNGPLEPVATNLSCPYCNNTMQAGRFPGTSAKIDRCNMCFGILLDRGELKELVQKTRVPGAAPIQLVSSQIVIEAESAEETNRAKLQNSLDQLRQQAHDITAGAVKPSLSSSISFFLSRLGRAFTLMFTEKEIFFFSLVQVAVIAFAYFLWVEFLSWIPREVWEDTSKQKGPGIVDILLLAWSFLCVGIAALPIGFMTACTGAVHLLHRQHRSSSIFQCVDLALPRLWPLWIYSWMDGWITVSQILERLPKKNDRTSPQERALKEALYYAWKVGTIGFIPSIVCGRGVVDACKLSLSFLRSRLTEIACLRLGYSALCWIIGISAYISVIFCFTYFDSFLPDQVEAGIHKFYLIAGIPIVVAVAFIQFFVRPLFLLVLFDLFTDFLTERKQPVLLERPKAGIWAIAVVYGLLLFTLAVAVVYRYELGIMKLLAIPLP